MSKTKKPADPVEQASKAGQPEAEQQAAETPPAAEAETQTPPDAEPAEKTEQAENAENAEKAAEAEQPSCEALQQQLAEQKDLLLRTAAEYDNYKKRTQREKEELSHFTKCALIKELLPALDNFERAAAAGEENPAEYRKGMEMSVRQLTEQLQKLGLTEIECEGQPFDPAYHNAVSQIEREDLGENVIAQVYQKGYLLGDTVVRHAMVVVANCR